MDVKREARRETFSKQMNVPPFLITLLHMARTCVCVRVCVRVRPCLPIFFPIKKKEKDFFFFHSTRGARSPHPVLSSRADLVAFTPY